MLSPVLTARTEGETRTRSSAPLTKGTGVATPNRANRRIRTVDSGLRHRPPRAAASLTYDIISYTNTGSITGTITTDGHTGVIGTGDITAWDITVTLSPTVLTYTNSTSRINSGGLSTGITATSTALYLNPAPAIPNELEFSIPGTANHHISWVAAQIYGADFNQSSDEPNFFGMAPLTAPIATVPSAVPEPSSAILAALGAAWVAAIGSTRHRREKSSASGR